MVVFYDNKSFSQIDNTSSFFYTGLAFVIALQIQKLFTSFESDIITPIASKFIDKNEKKYEIEIFDIKIKIGKFITSVVYFIFVIAFLYIILAIYNKL